MASSNTSNSLWHEVSETEKEKIKQEVKKLMNEFSTKLSSIKGIEEHFASSISETGTREQGKPWQSEPEFREIMFENAPFVEDEFITAEKGEWKKNV